MQIASTAVVEQLARRLADLVLVAAGCTTSPNTSMRSRDALHPRARDQRLVVVVGDDVEAVGVASSRGRSGSRARAAGSPPWPAVTIAPTRRPLRSSSRLSIAVPRVDAGDDRGKRLLGRRRPSSAAASSTEVDEADRLVLRASSGPCRRRSAPASSTMNVSVIVPPASMASTRGSCCLSVADARRRQ